MKKSLAGSGAKVKKGLGARDWGLGKKKISSKSPVPNPLSLLYWYDHSRRIMPWRALPGVRPNPYHVWLSEIMLQQTTVAAVAPYFQRFLKRWPTIKHLAKARLDDVLKMWAGLGYYRRAHGLHQCARQISAEYNGEFPISEKELLNLPGFGPYTAAAVAAIAFGQRASVVDGNVERVMARIFAIRTPMPKAKNKLRELAAGLLPDARYGDYAQALMDLGATICTPRNPKCDLCPWMQSCKAYTLGIQSQLPRRAKVKAKPIRYATAFVLFNKKGQIFIRKRPKQGLLGGMMEVPTTDWGEGQKPSPAVVRKQAPATAQWKQLPGTIKHVFTHFELQLDVMTGQAGESGLKGKWVDVVKLGNEALPSLMLKVIRHALKDV